ncbi:glycosyltransferase family 2 protein [Alkalibacillus sp. S2W]|uniref:glycosyltransferase family 2 protein n=1 Tax=Alkalibacillus sp. S2W TaxID=3386553 RepID=UPI00398D3C0D
MKNKHDDLVSIITPVFNAAEYIDNTINSVLKQTYTNWEMIIADDCSTDNTAENVLKYDDPRIRYLKMDDNSGAARARNKALDYAKGNFIAFLDSDDFWKETKLEKQLSFMLDKRIGFSFTGYEILGNEKNKIIEVPSSLNYNQFMKNTIIGTLTVIINRDIVGDFRIVDVKKDHDSMTWAKILRKNNIAYGLNESLAYYRKVDGSISNNKFKAAMTHWTNLRQIEKLSVFKSLYYFIFYGFNAVKKHYFS